MAEHPIFRQQKIVSEVPGDAVSCLPTLQRRADMFFEQMKSGETIARMCLVNHVCTIFVSINL